MNPTLLLGLEVEVEDEGDMEVEVEADWLLAIGFLWGMGGIWATSPRIPEHPNTF